MALGSKMRTREHLIGERAVDLVRASLPTHWVVREYRPDYGLDLAVEVFKEAPLGQVGVSAVGQFETLGEHFFVQVKGCEQARRQKLKVYARQNVEMEKEHLSKESVEIETAPFVLETSELVTVQRMGSALPVLLVVVDIETETCFFVCLNDYIDKVLVPRHSDYTVTKTRTVHLPTGNTLSSESGVVGLRWYAKRPKLYGAFQKFVYQYPEIKYLLDSDSFDELARHFASLISAYDFWDDTEMWYLVGHYGRALRRFLEAGSPGLLRLTDSALSVVEEELEDSDLTVGELLRRHDVLELWRGLSLLPRSYEDVCREWFLPTWLGVACTYDLP